MDVMSRDEFDDDWDDELGWVDTDPTSSGSRGVPARADRAVATTRGEDAVAATKQRARAAGNGSAPATVVARPEPALRSSLSPAGDAPLELEDDDWHVAPPPVPARPATSGALPRSTSKRRRGPLGSPVVLLALYSFAGIALIVLAVNLLSGSLGAGEAPQPVPAADRRPAEEPSAPVATATQATDPTSSGSTGVSDFELSRREAAAAAAHRAAIAAAERAERAARAAERRRIARERRARARARERAEARRRAAAPAPAGPATAAPSTPPPPPPASGGGGSGGGGGGGSCEFCIG
jgi:hypothetical protein